MSTEIFQILVILISYLIIVLGIGLHSYRYSKSTMEDYHMANRSFGTYVLFFAVFGTNISAVALVGGPGRAYHIGWITWAYFVTSWGWLSPLLYYIIGRRTWILGKKFGSMTPSDILFKRWNSKILCILTSCFMIFYTIAYVLTGIIGGGRTFEGLTNGFIPYWLGALICVIIVCIYVSLGGMRGTAWTNVFQTHVFVIGGLLIFFYVVKSLGGLSFATEKVMESYPELLSRSKLPIKSFFSYGIILALANAMFPQVFIRILTGKNPKTLKRIVQIYPLATLIIWFPMSIIGMFGKLVFPEFIGSQSDKIMPMLIVKFTPIWMTGILGAAIFAAMMSSLDAQLLTLGTLVSRDMLVHIKKKGFYQENFDVIISRGLIIFFALIAFAIALITPKGIITIIEWSFGGYACLIIPVLAALYWKRCTKWGAIFSILISQFILISIPLKILPNSITFGMLPGIPALVFGLLGLVSISFLTAPDKKIITNNFFIHFEKK